MKTREEYVESLLNLGYQYEHADGIYNLYHNMLRLDSLELYIKNKKSIKQTKEAMYGKRD